MKRLLLTGLMGCALALGGFLPEQSDAQTNAQNTEAQITSPLEQGVKIEPREEWSFVEAGLVPMQSGGRVKPLGGFAQETVLFITGSRKYQGWEPVDLVLSWLTFPAYWEKQKFIKVPTAEVRKQLLLDPKQGRYSPYELFHNSVFLQYANKYSQASPLAVGRSGTTELPPEEKELRRVVDRLSTFRQIVSGEVWQIIPRAQGVAGEVNNRWANILDQSEDSRIIRGHFADLAKAYYTSDERYFERVSVMLRAAVEGQVPGWSNELKNKLLAETTYYRLRPFGLSWVFYLIAGLFWIFSIASKGTAGPRWKRMGFVFTVAAFLCQSLGFGLRMVISDRPPVTNMYESVIWVAFGVILFAAYLYWRHRQKIVMAVGCALSGFALIAADIAPAILDPGLHPLVPVLRDNFWLTTHVLTITLGYAAFALTLGLANVTLYHFWKSAKEKKPSYEVTKKIAGLNQLTYRAMQFGVVLLAAGTILGGIWADYSWGRFWGWDPKEVWALVALLTYVAILHGRFTGWIGQFGFAAWSVIAFMSVIMAWYGVNFVLGVGLHAYGFSTGGGWWVGGGLGIQFLYVAGVFCKRKAYEWQRDWETKRIQNEAKKKNPDKNKDSKTPVSQNLDDGQPV